MPIYAGTVVLEPISYLQNLKDLVNISSPQKSD